MCDSSMSPPAACLGLPFTCLVSRGVPSNPKPGSGVCRTPLPGRGPALAGGHGASPRGPGAARQPQSCCRRVTATNPRRPVANWCCLMLSEHLLSYLCWQLLVLVAVVPGQRHRDQEGMLGSDLGTRRGCSGLASCAWSSICPRLGCAAGGCQRARRDGDGKSPFYQELPRKEGHGMAQLMAQHRDWLRGSKGSPGRQCPQGCCHPGQAQQALLLPQSGPSGSTLRKG